RGLRASWVCSDLARQRTAHRAMAGDAMIWLVLVFTLVVVGYAEGAERFASPTPSGGVPCTNSSAPCSVATALRVVLCGDTVTLLSGVYLGTSQMLSVSSGSTPNGYNCTASRPVLVRSQSRWWSDLRWPRQP